MQPHCDARPAGTSRSSGAAGGLPAAARARPAHQQPRPRRRPRVAAAASGLAASEFRSDQPRPLVERTFEHDWRTPLPDHDHTDPSRRPILALGKFDALHLGHRELAASALALGGAPVLLSFSGMAAVLGWAQRKPLVAPCDRPRVLALWAAQLAGSSGSARPLPVRQRYVPFAAIRSMSPGAFVQLLADDLRAAGVVAGSNYRFGYRAAGDTAQLQQLCARHGLGVSVVQLVGTGQPGAAAVEGAVSSSKIRDLLAHANVEAAAACLGRPYRLVVALDLAQLLQQQQTQTQQQQRGTAAAHGPGAWVSSDACLNLQPAPGVYLADVALYVGASGHDDLLALQQQAAGAAAATAGAGGSSSSGWALARAGRVACIQGALQEVELAGDGLLLPAALLEAAADAWPASSSSSGGGGEAHSAAEARSISKGTDPLCWDTDDSEACELGEVLPSGQRTSALLVLELQRCVLQLRSKL